MEDAQESTNHEVIGAQDNTPLRSRYGVKNKNKNKNAFSNLIIFLFIAGIIAGLSASSPEVTLAQEMIVPEIVVVPLPPAIPVPLEVPESVKEQRVKWGALYEQSRACLMQNVFYEAPRYFPGMENHKKYKGITREALKRQIKAERIKVINVTMNRSASSLYPTDICSVVYQYKQFSWTLDNRKRHVDIEQRYDHHPVELQNVQEVKALVDFQMLQGFADLSYGATYYHTHWVYPRWSKTKDFEVASLWHKYYSQPKNSNRR